MVTLSPSQSADVRELADALTEHDPSRPVLLLAPPKSGKRTIARAAADRLALKFVPISLHGTAQDLSVYLFGSEGAGPDGDCGAIGRSAETLLYFSDLEFLPAELHGDFYRVVAERSYQSPRGALRLPQGCTIVAGLRVGGESGLLTSEHWVRTSFPRHLVLQPPRRRDFYSLVSSMIRDLGHHVEVAESVADVFGSLSATQWSLGDLRGWIRAVLAARAHDSAEPLSSQVIMGALAEDAVLACAGVSYRGSALPRADLLRWVAQFPADMQVEAIHVAREAATTYFFGLERFYRSLRDLVDNAGVERKENVTFCQFDRLGQSGAHIAHEIKNMLRLQPTEHIDCSSFPIRWPDLDPESVRVLLVADDFVGTGQSICRSLRGPSRSDPDSEPSPLRALADRFPNARIVVLVVCGLRKGLQRLQRTLDELVGARAKLVVSRILTDEDRCFHDQSRIFPDPRARERVRRVFVEIGRERFFGLRSDNILGHAGSQLLVVFYNTVPNNTLPHIWFDADGSNWFPLFSASDSKVGTLVEPPGEGKGSTSWRRRVWSWAAGWLWPWSRRDR